MSIAVSDRSRAVAQIVAVGDLGDLQACGSDDDRDARSAQAAHEVEELAESLSLRRWGLSRG